MQETTTVNVIFQPDGQSVEIPYGETILAAAMNAGIILNIPCGGHGKCCKCSVIVLTGKTEAKGDFHDAHYTPEEIKEGYCLACQTKVLGDVKVFIPSESKITGQKILSQCIDSVIIPNTSLKKLQIRIAPPVSNSNISDIDRLLIELIKYYPTQQITIPYELICLLPKTLRANDWKVTVFLEEINDATLEITKITSDTKTQLMLGLAIDIGTTTIVANLVDLISGKVLKSASCVNSQILRGEDVITRIHYASISQQNLEKLQQLIIKDINNLIGNLVTNPKDITAISLSGNTVMSHLLVGIDPSFIWREPFTPVFTHLPKIKAKALGLNVGDHTYSFITPCVSSYAGGDLISNVLLANIHSSEKPSLLVDIGTNGEIVLGCNSWMLSCSVPAGPALEGAEVKCGMRASIGAINSITLDYQTLEPKITVIGDGKPVGICGSGLIDLFAELFRANILTKDGKIINVSNSRIRKGIHGLEYVVAFAKESQTRKDIVLTEYDIANLLKTKGAFYAGYLVLLRAFDLTFDELETVYISGGFGNHINITNAITIGLFPDISQEKFKFLGNGSLGGARLTLLSYEKQKEALEIARKITNIELSNSYEFMDEYTLASFIPHTNLEFFPSVKPIIKEGGIKN
ncbi:MAG: DUF4445 domain-containing protein [Candidatus Heimdallarchaeota archaeon]|nr:DUF4445 domain-containing protein [Candidatus Heimdallarchaeota archaeon]